MTVKLAVLGCGWVADMHVRAAAACGAEVVGIANHRIESAERFAAEHGIERVTTEWRELINVPEVDAVVVCTPNALHARQSIAALDAGKHVLCEKPMATRVADGEEMLATAARNDKLLLVLHPWRHDPAVIALRDAIVDGELGRIVRTHGYGVHAGWGPSGWFTDLALAGGGALVDMGIHAIDTARFLLGEPDALRVRASITTAHGSYEVDDDGLVLIEWEGGARSVVESGWWQPHLGGYEADTEVYGSAGYRRIWAREQPPGYVHCDVSLFTAQLRDAIGQIEDWRPGAPSPTHGLAALRICEQAYESAEYAPRMPADRPLRIAGIAGSLRRGSFNRGLLRAAIEFAPEGMTVHTLEIRDLPLYDADLDVDGGPEAVQAFKAGIIEADGLLIATPEYNYSLPGVLKNALDWASRAPERALTDKPVAIVGATPGRWGTVRSQLALRQMLMFPACRVLPFPQLTIPEARGLFDEDGNLTDDTTRAHLVAVLDAFSVWIQQVS